MTSDTTKPCPYCAETIQAAAKKCRFCGEWLEEGVRPDAADTESDTIAGAAAGIEGIELEDPAAGADGPEDEWVEYARSYSLKQDAERRAAWQELAPEQREALLDAWVTLGFKRENAIPAEKMGWGRKLVAAFVIIVFATFLWSLLTVDLEESARGTSASERSPSQDPAQSATPTPPARETTWTRLASWNGSGMKDTETFRTASREWRIHWETKDEAFAGAGLLQIYVYEEGGDLVTIAANKQGVGSDVSYVRGSPGRYYLQINSANVDWSVRVEHQR